MEIHWREIGDDRRGELTTLGGIWLDLFVGSGDRLKKHAGIQVAGNNRGPRGPARANGLPAINLEPASGLFRLARVALVALLDEHGANLGLEERDALGVVGSARRCGQRRQEGEQANEAAGMF